ncbi:hypothetical protein LINPERPRIM_LOCUS24548 [Linum perenne]
MAEWSKAPDSSSGLRKKAWVQIPLLTFLLFCISKQILIPFAPTKHGFSLAQSCSSQSEFDALVEKSV